MVAQPGIRFTAPTTLTFFEHRRASPRLSPPTGTAPPSRGFSLPPRRRKWPVPPLRQSARSRSLSSSKSSIGAAAFSSSASANAPFRPDAPPGNPPRESRCVCLPRRPCTRPRFFVAVPRASRSAHTGFRTSTPCHRSRPHLFWSCSPRHASTVLHLPRDTLPLHFVFTAPGSSNCFARRVQ